MGERAKAKRAELLVIAAAALDNCDRDAMRHMLRTARRAHPVLARAVAAYLVAEAAADRAHNRLHELFEKGGVRG